MEVKERVIEVLSKVLDMNKLDIKEKDDFIEDYGIDSLDMAEIIMEMENEFGLKIDDFAVENIKTVMDLVKKIEKMRLGR